MKKLTCLILLLCIGLVAAENVDLSVVSRIRTEAFERSKMTDLMYSLTDLNGPRVTNSTGFYKAADWAVKTLTDYGLVNVKKEAWGPYGRGWENQYFSAHMLEPNYSPLIGYALAYTESTQGVVTGEAILAPLRTEADFAKYKGKLKGKVVLMDLARGAEPPAAMPAYLRVGAQEGRHTDADLAALATAPESNPMRRMMADYQAQREFRSKIAGYLREEGVLAVLSHGRIGDNGTVFGSQGGTHDVKQQMPPAMAVIAMEQYNRMVRLLEKNVPVKIQIEARNKVQESPTESINVIGEIPGGAKKDEVVMIGGHLDSWQGGTGATDNAAGVAVCMEALRILKALNVKMDRTVRVGLWAAEEQGLLGSRAYVKEHFGDRDTMQLKPEHAKLAAYFNYDNGSGKIRGIYLQGNDMARPIFEEWLKPFADTGATTVTIRNTGGTDHQSFDAVGLPGFQFIQDPLNYSSKTHHSNMDVMENVKVPDLMQSAAIMASFVYNAATRPEMLPRKPLPAAGAGGRRP